MWAAPVKSSTLKEAWEICGERASLGLEEVTDSGCSPGFSGEEAEGGVPCSPVPVGAVSWGESAWESVVWASAASAFGGGKCNLYGNSNSRGGMQEGGNVKI